MSEKQPHNGVLFYAPTDARHIMVGTVSPQIKPDIKERPRRDPLEIFLAREIANSPIIVVDEDAPLNNAVKLMTKSEIGCLIVVSKKEKPIGIMTEGDIIAKVLAKDKNLNKMMAKEVMTSPLITIDSEVPIYGVARMMDQYRIGRLGVIYKNKLVGIISKRDIVEFLPRMTEILQETPPWTYL